MTKIDTGHLKTEKISGGNNNFSYKPSISSELLYSEKYKIMQIYVPNGYKRSPL
jgi:hypothetical protein